MSNSRHAPSEEERDEKVGLDLPLTFEETAQVLVAVKPDDLPAEERKAEA